MVSFLRSPTVTCWHGVLFSEATAFPHVLHGRQKKAAGRRWDKNNSSYIGLAFVTRTQEATSVAWTQASQKARCEKGLYAGENMPLSHHMG